MKKFFSLVLVLVMALSLTTVAWGATVTDESGLNSAITAGGEVVLGGDVEITTTITISNTVVVDLAGYKLTGPDDGSANWYAFIVGPGGKLTLKDSSAAQTGVLFAKCYGVETKGGTFVMESGKIDATTNGGIGAAIVNYGGTVIVNGGELVASNWAVNAQSYFADATVEINGGTLETTSATEAAIQVGKDYSNTTETVTINGGEIIGDKAVSVDKDTADVTIAGGDVEGTVAASAGDLTVTGGTFDSDVSAYVADNVVSDGNGNYITVSASTTKYTLWDAKVAATATGVNYIATNLQLPVAKAAVAPTATALYGSVAYYTVNGNTYVSASAADADVYYTVAGKTTAVMHLKQVANPGYHAVATVFNNFGDMCGQVPAKYKAADTIYYTWTDLNDNTVVVAGSTTKLNASIDNVLVNGVLVPVVIATNVYDNANEHMWTFAKDAATKKFVSAKCEECGAVATVYATYAAVPYGADYIKQVGPDGATYFLVIGAPTGGSVSTDKVTSAETFDAGIAMYVGMSVMAAVGSAVVLKKKD